MAFRVFTRTWWAEDGRYPKGLRPEAGRKRTLVARVETEEQARAICREWNATHKPGRLSRKAEYEGR